MIEETIRDIPGVPQVSKITRHFEEEFEDLREQHFDHVLNDPTTV